MLATLYLTVGSPVKSPTVIHFCETASEMSDCTGDNSKPRVVVLGGNKHCL